MQSPDPVLRGDGASGMSTGVATIVAVAWVAALVGVSIGLFFSEESRVTTNPAFVAVLVVVTVAFVVAPFLAGRIHRTTTVRNVVAVLGVVGWLVCMRYGFWAYSNIGGGP